MQICWRRNVWSGQIQFSNRLLLKKIDFVRNTTYLHGIFGRFWAPSPAYYVGYGGGGARERPAVPGLTTNWAISSTCGSMFWLRFAWFACSILIAWKKVFEMPVARLAEKSVIALLLAYWVYQAEIWYFILLQKHPDTIQTIRVSRATGAV